MFKKLSKFFNFTEGSGTSRESEEADVPQSTKKKTQSINSQNKNEMMIPLSIVDLRDVKSPREVKLSLAKAPMASIRSVVSENIQKIERAMSGNVAEVSIADQVKETMESIREAVAVVIQRAAEQKGLMIFNEKRAPDTSLDFKKLYFSFAVNLMTINDSRLKVTFPKCKSANKQTGKEDEKNSKINVQTLQRIYESVDFDSKYLRAGVSEKRFISNRSWNVLNSKDSRRKLSPNFDMKSKTYSLESSIQPFTNKKTKATRVQTVRHNEHLNKPSVSGIGDLELGNARRSTLREDESIKMCKKSQPKSEGDVKRSCKTARLKISELDNLTTIQDIRKVVAKQGYCRPSEIHLSKIVCDSKGLGIVWVQCPILTALIIAKKKRLRVSWSSAPVVLDDPLWKCSNCLHSCPNKCFCIFRKGRIKTCFKCGSMDHKVENCRSVAKCPLCFDIGLNDNHVMGSPACVTVT